MTPESMKRLTHELTHESETNREDNVMHTDTQPETTHGFHNHPIYGAHCECKDCR